MILPPFLNRVLLVVFSFFSLTISAQSQSDYELSLKSGKSIPEKTIDFESAILPSVSELNSENIYRIVQFDNIPTTLDKENMKEIGLVLISYVPNNAFICSISKTVSASKLKNFDIRSIIKIKPNYKVSKSLTEEKLQNGH